MVRENTFVTTALRCESISACVAIPVYNHARTVGDVVRGALKYASTVLVCDDGSSDGSGEQAKLAGATLIAHPENRGKGAALRTLFAEAIARGFRYVICLDADGQHLPDDMPALIAEVEKEPGCVVVGARDLAKAGAPGSSQFGRKFSNFWVWFESGLKVEDSQSGFRAYPLPETQLLAGWLSRYDFEVDVLLRAAWAGLPIRSTPIGVIYPKDRVTHFRPFLDNVRISLLNTLTCLRLLLPLPMAPLLHERARWPGLTLDAFRRWAWLGGLGPIWRGLAALLGIELHGLGVGLSAVVGAGALPALASWVLARVLGTYGVAPTEQLFAVVGGAVFCGAVELWWRRRLVAAATKASGRSWDGRNRGGVLGNWIMVQLVRLFGAKPAYWVLRVVCLYFLVAAPDGRRASKQFLDLAMGPAGALESLKRTYWHFLWFARGLVDRLVMGAMGAKAFTYSEDGIEHIVQTSKSGKGSLLLTAHLGNYELGGNLLDDGRLGCPLSIVIFQNEAEAVKRVLENRMGPVPNILAVGNTELGSLNILRALRDGHMVCIGADRSLDERKVWVPFFGRLAAFPVGPFFLAAIAQVPIIATFCLQVGPQQYEMMALPPQLCRFERGVDRDVQLKSWVAEYAASLEAVTRRYPYQWFNFYDFWAEGSVASDKKGPQNGQAAA